MSVPTVEVMWGRSPIALENNWLDRFADFQKITIPTSALVPVGTYKENYVFALTKDGKLFQVLRGSNAFKQMRKSIFWTGGGRKYESSYRMAARLRRIALRRFFHGISGTTKFFAKPDREDDFYFSGVTKLLDATASTFSERAMLREMDASIPISFRGVHLLVSMDSRICDRSVELSCSIGPVNGRHQTTDKALGSLLTIGLRSGAITLPEDAFCKSIWQSHLID